MSSFEYHAGNVTLIEHYNVFKNYLFCFLTDFFLRFSQNIYILLHSYHFTIYFNINYIYLLPVIVIHFVMLLFLVSLFHIILDGYLQHNFLFSSDGQPKRKI